MENNQDTLLLEKKLKYKFKEIKYLNNSLLHSSYVNEHPEVELSDNERLEFLGDAVLNLIIGHILMEKFPLFEEGNLSRMRANLVNESSLAIIAKKIDLGSFIKLSKGEINTNGRDKNSILSDTFEAIIAAIYLDGGFDEAFRITKIQFSDLFITHNIHPSIQDSKSFLQEYAQIKYKLMPLYKVIHESGPDHDKTFRVKLKIADLIIEGVGKSKKTAEQDAAKNALKSLAIG